MTRCFRVVFSLELLSITFKTCPHHVIKGSSDLKMQFTWKILKL